MRKLQLIYVSLIALFLACNSSPEQKKSEKTLASSEVPKVVTADIEEGIKVNIAKKVEEGSGYFHMNTDDGELKLQLVRVHTEY
ncbi:MAG: transglutaminase domain-containing protein, partial [Flavobacteriaceae bacterium]|nr:transglutaminase domain-containing protein [Flavobacteriaceae bacterium]